MPMPMPTLKRASDGGLFAEPDPTGPWPPELLETSRGEDNGLRWAVVDVVDDASLALEQLVVVFGHHPLDNVRSLLERLAWEREIEEPFEEGALFEQWGWVYDVCDLPLCACLEDAIDSARHGHYEVLAELEPNDECGLCLQRAAFDRPWRFSYADDTTTTPSYARNASPVMVWRPWC